MTEVQQQPAAAGRRQAFSAEALTLGQMRAGSDGNDGVRYVIPPFQRPYCWTEAQATQLMEDLIDFFRLPDTGRLYSLGAIVCDADPAQRVFSILDGQQRLTTMDLAFSVLEAIRQQAESEAQKPSAGDAPAPVEAFGTAGASGAGAPRLVSAYRYLRGCESKEETPVPASEIQKKAVRTALCRFLDERCGKEVNGWGGLCRELERCFLTRVVVNRIVIPLSADVANEAPMMFEIINMRGQKLSALDRLKSRLLAVFGEEAVFERALFADLWSQCEAVLADPAKAAKGFDLAAWRRRLQSGESAAALAPALEQEALSLEEILASEMPEEAAEESAKASEPEPQQAVRPEVVPPIDMLNLLDLSNELLKAKLRAEAPDREVFKPEALTAKDINWRFSWLIGGGEKNAGAGGTAANVWRLMGVLAAALRTVGAWAPYRAADPRAGAGEGGRDADPMRQLALSFMAANSYQAAGQYWLLVLVQDALANAAPDAAALPTSAEAFLSMKALDFKRLKPTALRHLLAWGALTALGDEAAGRVLDVDENDQMTFTTKALRLAERFPGEAGAAEALRLAKAAMAEEAPTWCFGDRRNRWRLYFTDFLLWCDFAAESFGTLEAVAKSSVFPENPALEKAARGFPFDDFRARAARLRIVSRSDVEHFFARNRAAEDETEAIDGFGNLALIDRSANSAASDKSLKDKALQVLDQTNPAMKHLWLAELCREGEAYSPADVSALSGFWARFFGALSLEKAVQISAKKQ